jgi:hypothetical protein
VCRQRISATLEIASRREKCCACASVLAVKQGACRTPAVPSRPTQLALSRRHCHRDGFERPLVLRPGDMLFVVVAHVAIIARIIGNAQVTSKTGRCGGLPHVKRRTARDERSKTTGVRAGTQHEITARKLLALLGPMFVRPDCQTRRAELSLLFSPKVIRNAAYRAKYQSPKDCLTRCGIEIEQEITEYRPY